jgi:hypothetical protein
MELTKNTAITNRVDILALVLSDGFSSKKVASTHGGEYAGPCPWCGGNDRFLIWPEYKGGRYWCRGCEKTGDAIQYIRDTRELTFSEALEYLGIEKPRLKKSHRKTTAGGAPSFTPKVEALPPPLWIEKASNILKWSQGQLWIPGNRAALEILTGKGLNEETIRAAGIGWNPGERGGDVYRDRRGWGLSPEVHRDGRPKLLWIPQGLVIPLPGNEGVRRLRVRRNNPGGGPRYVIVAGSQIAPLILGSSGKNVFVIVESELDGWLIWQEAGDLVGVVAMGSASSKPDVATHEILIQAETILNALDSDPAGAKHAWKFWPETYGSKVIRWPVSIGKDPSDAWQQGLNIRSWIEAGLSE